MKRTAVSLFVWCAISAWAAAGYAKRGGGGAKQPAAAAPAAQTNDDKAAADAGYTWLGVVIVVGSMISLAYYLKVIAAMWMRPASAADVATVDAAGAPRLAGADPAAERADWERRGEFVHGGVSLRQSPQYCPARGVGERREGRAELVDRHP